MLHHVSSGEWVADGKRARLGFVGISTCISLVVAKPYASVADEQIIAMNAAELTLMMLCCWTATAQAQMSEYNIHTHTPTSKLAYPELMCSCSARSVLLNVPKLLMLHSSTYMWPDTGLRCSVHVLVS